MPVPQKKWTASHKLTGIPQPEKCIHIAMTVASDLKNLFSNSHLHDEYLCQVCEIRVNVRMADWPRYCLLTPLAGGRAIKTKKMEHKSYITADRMTAVQFNKNTVLKHDHQLKSQHAFWQCFLFVTEQQSFSIWDSSYDHWLTLVISTRLDWGAPCHAKHRRC